MHGAVKFLGALIVKTTLQKRKQIRSQILQFYSPVRTFNKSAWFKNSVAKSERFDANPDFK